MARGWRSIALLCMVVGGCGAPLLAQSKKPTLAGCRLEFDVQLAADTESLTLTVVVPGDVRGRQTLRDEKFSPKPKELLTEADVRYAVFELAGNGKAQNLSVRIDSQLELVAPVQGVPKLKNGQRDGGDDEAWRAAETWIESEDPRIVAMAKTLRGKEASELARSAAETVIAHLEFGGYSPLARGALGGLTDKSGDCSEYTDLTVALLRARGVPARHVQGFTVDWTDTPKHSWVEVHLPRVGWTLMDPTRAETDPQALLGPKPNYVWLSTRRNDERLGGHYYFRYAYRGAAAKVTGTVTMVGGKNDRGAAL